jgi:hypothetical protein
MKILQIGLLLFFTISIAISQNRASLSGLVKDKDSKETLIRATISLKGTKFGAYTNKSGFYSIRNLPKGDYEVSISSVGYDKLIVNVKIGDNEAIRKDFELKPSSSQSKTLIVTAEKEEEKREINISKVDIPIAQIKEIRIGGESDIFRSLQLLPGVLTSSQISSGLYIRGGSPDQNLVLLDGTTVYNPTHLFGFISTFNSDVIKDVELIKGGFQSEYGGRLSAVLNIEQKDGNQEKFQGTASIGAISSKGTVEIPIGNGALSLGGRRTYFELIKAVIPADPANPLPDFNFYDLNAKLFQNFGENDRVSVSAFRSKDNLQLASNGISLALGIENSLLSSRWTHIFSEAVFSSINLSASEYINGFSADNAGFEVLTENKILDYSLKANVEWLASEDLTSKFGAEINNYYFTYLTNFTGNTDSTSQGSGAGRTNLNFEDWAYSLFSQANYNLSDQISLQAGLRGSYWKLANQTTFDPRLAARYHVVDGVYIKGSWGIFHQNLKLASQPDFSFFDTWTGTDTSLNIARSIHYILSLETEPFEGYNFNFDVYYKTLENINELNRNALQITKVSDALYEGRGESYGLEVFLQKKMGNFTGWAGYAFGYIWAQFDSINFGRRFNPRYDRRHDFKLVAQYQINDDWEAGANFFFQSGQPYTGATSRYQSFLPSQTRGGGKIYNSDRFGLRLPPSHQLNLNVSYKFTTFGAPSRVILDIYNVYSRRDIWFRFYNTQTEEVEVTDVRLLPILPTISFEIKF